MKKLNTPAKDKSKAIKQPDGQMDTPMNLLMDHYVKARQDMDTRRLRKNGWNDVIDAFMGRLPANWPYTSRVVDPRIRTTILEKNARLINSKLQGRLIPRNNSDIVKAEINNAILDYQWDTADKNGPMQEKVAQADLYTRQFGASFAYVYWDDEKNCNEMKVWDPRDVFIDFSATHVKNANWIQLREWTTKQTLEERGYDLKDVNFVESPVLRGSEYESKVKINLGLQDRLGQDRSNPVVECVTEWTKTKKTVFLPKFKKILEETTHAKGRIPVSMLRYYPLGDDVYGQSEVEVCIGLWRGINSVLNGFLDEMNISMRPPLKIMSGQARIETIVYGPAAQWIITGNNPNAVTEAQLGAESIANFNNTYPALVAAYNTAMGDSSLGTNSTTGKFMDKTATEVNQLGQQQNMRDQYNQLYLAEFLKDIMEQWLANNKKYLFNAKDKTKIIKIIGKDRIQQFQQMELDAMYVPEQARQAIGQTFANSAAMGMSAPQDMVKAMNELSVPKYPVLTNPEETNPENYKFTPKMTVHATGKSADLYIEPDDIDGNMSYIPDVKSMAAGYGQMQQDANQQALNMAVNPVFIQGLAQQGFSLKYKEIGSMILEASGTRDAEALFESNAQNQGQPNGQPNQSPQANPGINQLAGQSGLPTASQPMSPMDTGNNSAPAPGLQPQQAL